MLFTLLLLLLPPKHFDMRGIKYPLLQESKHCKNLEKVAPKSSRTAKKRAEPSKYHHPWESMRCDNLIVGGDFQESSEGGGGLSTLLKRHLLAWWQPFFHEKASGFFWKKNLQLATKIMGFQEWSWVITISWWYPKVSTRWLVGLRFVFCSDGSNTISLNIKHHFPNMEQTLMCSCTGNCTRTPKFWLQTNKHRTSNLSRPSKRITYLTRSSIIFSNIEWTRIYSSF